MANVFIDGQEGTTGLKIAKRLHGRPDITLISISDSLRKDIGERRRKMEEADIVILCLPDAAARESVELAQGTGARIIDASTAHRTQPGWAYGFPELSIEHREDIVQGNRITVPGCHASGFAAIVYPLRNAGVMPKEYPVVCHSLTGYSGGGKKMIAEYEDEKRSVLYDSPRQYALTQAHKHLPEMQAVCGLKYPPFFNPIVADFYSGMVVSVSLHVRLLDGKPDLEDIHSLLKSHYDGAKLVKVLPLGAEADMNGFLPANGLSGRDDMEILVSGTDDRILITARFDNLGKGASGAAVQCMNLMLKTDELNGLVC